jgi:hypothetical protein
MQWVYFNTIGLRVRQQDATFAALEVPVDAGLPVPLGIGSWAAREYHDAHHVSEPDNRRTFVSIAEMKAWFEERSSAADQQGNVPKAKAKPR